MTSDPAVAHNSPAGYVDGSNSECDNWKIVFLNLGFTSIDYEIAEEGWVWVDPTRKLQNASGVVTNSKIAHNDTPANHYSHDWNADIRVDPGQEYLLSDKNSRDVPGSEVPTKIELEWETGIVPEQKTGDGFEWFPSWVRPSIGDRIWTNGHWVFDCGHGSGVTTPYPVDGDPSSCPAGTLGAFGVCADNHFRTEIHPGRAIATMRRQAATLPGGAVGPGGAVLPATGTTPVPVTATDLFIHGQGAFMVKQLECGVGVILTETTDSCPDASYGDDLYTTDIDDLYTFDICLPPKPSHPSAMPSWSITEGPGNTRSEAVNVEEAVAEGGCDLPPDEFGNDFDNDLMLKATIDLRNSGAVPEDVYARKIVAGWAFPPDEPLHHLNVTLEQMDLHDDKEFDPGDGDMAFFWMNVNRSPSNEWYRLSDFDVADPGDPCDPSYRGMEDYDDDNYFGDGLMDFCGPVYDFYLARGDTFTVRTVGYEQDCYDRFFGFFQFTLFPYIFCHTNPLSGFTGNNDRMASILATYGVQDAGTRPEPTAGLFCLPIDPPLCGGEYELEFRIDELPLGLEDTADLEVAKDCSQDGEVPLAGQPFTCTITIDNNGPGLPRHVRFSDTLTTALEPSQYTLGTPTATVGPRNVSVPCAVQPPNAFTCDIGTVPVGEQATIEIDVTPRAAGLFSNTAVVTTDSTDPISSNDFDEVNVDVHLPITVDVSPGDPVAAVNPTRKGLITVAVISDARFDARALNASTACFGDAEVPAQRDCSEAHGTGHLADIDRDRDLDLLLHYDTLETGIDRGDRRACLIARTFGGLGVYGCDSIVTT